MALLYDALKEKGKTLVFVQRKATASWLQGQLWKDKAEAIHGDRTQSQRESALAAFRNGKCRVLVATDVAARGLDIPNVAHVVQFDMPASDEDFDTYVRHFSYTSRVSLAFREELHYCCPSIDPRR